jgi:phosphatidylserine/phosphatidylglycerophosphate/cardiolipin synthase-like enzyme
MAKFLTTHAAAAEIEQIITTAREKLVLVCPYLRLSQLFADRLQDADRRGVRITLVYGKEELAPEQLEFLKGLRRLRLYFLPNLHAKCYHNDARMVITSMNMYEFSEKSNREMGVMIEAGEESYQEAVAEVRSIIVAARAYETSSDADARRAPQVGLAGFMRAGLTRRRGRCIRCARSIRLNPERPLCGECYAVWASYGDPDYVEQVCHACGRPDRTSVQRPLCFHCYREFTHR